MSLKLKAAKLELWPGINGEDAAFSLEVSPQSLNLSDFFCKIGQAPANANLHLHRASQYIDLDGAVKIKDFAINLPLLRGRLTGSLNFAGGGQNNLALIKNLAGAGAGSLNDVSLLRSDPLALHRVMERLENDSILPDRQDVEARLEDELSHAPFLLKTGDFNLELADGKLRFEPLEPANDAKDRRFAAKLSGEFDLARGQLSEKTSLTEKDLPKDWKAPLPQITLGFAGSPTRPSRSIEAGAFLNALAERAISLESTRLENFEFDLHEQAFFRERLRSERRREQENLNQQEKIDENLRHAREAVRLERQRKEDLRRKVEDLLKGLAPSGNKTGAPNGAGLPLDPSSAGRY
jgi:hypothetical protein